MLSPDLHCFSSFRAKHPPSTWRDQDQAAVLHRTCSLFALSHPALAPLSMTCEQMVHSRRRVTRAPRRKCNCCSNYVLTTTGRQPEPNTLTAACWEPRERSRLCGGAADTSGPPLGWHTDWQADTTVLIDPAVYSRPLLWLCVLLSPRCEVVKQRGEEKIPQISSQLRNDNCQTKGITFLCLGWKPPL